jgi:hypothetical protein
MNVDVTELCWALADGGAAFTVPPAMANSRIIRLAADSLALTLLRTALCQPVPPEQVPELQEWAASGGSLSTAEVRPPKPRNA